LRSFIKTYVGKNGVCGGNADIIAINEIYKVPVSVYFVSGGHNTQSTDSSWKVLNERKVPVWLDGD
jgi:hypothetical protein